MNSRKERIEQIIKQHSDTVLLTGDMQIDDEDAVDALLLLISSEVVAARKRGWLGALKWARTTYDDMESKQQDYTEVTWSGWKLIRNRLTDEIERITGDRVGKDIKPNPPEAEETKA